MSISDDIKTIKQLEKYLKGLDKDVNLNKDDQSIYCQELKKQYLDLAKKLSLKHEELNIKIQALHKSLYGGSYDNR